MFRLNKTLYVRSCFYLDSFLRLESSINVVKQSINSNLILLKSSSDSFSNKAYKIVDCEYNLKFFPKEKTNHFMVGFSLDEKAYTVSLSSIKTPKVSKEGKFGDYGFKLNEEGHNYLVLIPKFIWNNTSLSLSQKISLTKKLFHNNAFNHTEGTPELRTVVWNTQIAMDKDEYVLCYRDQYKVLNKDNFFYQGNLLLEENLLSYSENNSNTALPIPSSLFYTRELSNPVINSNCNHIIHSEMNYLLQSLFYIKNNMEKILKEDINNMQKIKKKLLDLKIAAEKNPSGEYAASLLNTPHLDEAINTIDNCDVIHDYSLKNEDNDLSDEE